MKNKSLKSLRDKLTDLYMEYEALYCLVNAMTIKYREGFEKTKSYIPKASQLELETLTHRMKGEISYFRKHYGAKVTNRVLVDLHKKAQGAHQGKMYLIPKSLLDDLFDNYTNVFPTYKYLPPHARIGIDVGTFREVQGTVEVYILEACIFEDICAIYNLAKKFYETLKNGEDTKENIKTANALYRSTITSSYYFIESYLNGIVFDYFIQNESNLTENVKSLLTEWDSKNNREQFISIRDKLLQYPKIILGLTHPPLQESNCDEIKILLGKSKLLRDSIVHASPKPDMQSFDPIKEKVFFAINHEDATEVVDNAIKLIRIIEEKIYGNLDRLDWLSERNSEGYFDSKVFD